MLEIRGLFLVSCHPNGRIKDRKLVSVHLTPEEADEAQKNFKFDGHQKESSEIWELDLHGWPLVDKFGGLLNEHN